MYHEPVVTIFKGYCFELLLWDNPLVRSPVGEEMLDNVWVQPELREEFRYLLICTASPTTAGEFDMLTPSHL